MVTPQEGEGSNTVQSSQPSSVSRTFVLCARDGFTIRCKARSGCSRAPELVKNETAFDPTLFAYFPRHAHMDSPYVARSLEIEA